MLNKQQDELGEKRAGDRAEIVHHPLEPVSAAVNRSWDDIGKQRVPGGDSKTPGRPRRCSEDADLPDGGRHADQRRQDRRGRVAAKCAAPPSLWIVGEGASDKPGNARAAVGDTFDQAECGT